MEERMPLACLTLQLADNKSEEITLYTGDNINRVINLFSEKHYLDSELASAIKEELKNQLSLNVDIYIDNSGFLKEKNTKESNLIKDSGFTFNNKNHSNGNSYYEMNMKKKQKMNESQKSKKRGKTNQKKGSFSQNKGMKTQDNEQTTQKNHSGNLNPYEALLNKLNNNDKNENILKGISEKEEEGINPYERLIKLMSPGENKKNISSGEPFLYKTSSISKNKNEFISQEEQSDASLAEIYECLQENLNNCNKEKNLNLKRNSKGSRKNEKIKPKVYNKVNKEEIRKKLIKKFNLQEEEGESNKSKTRTTSQISRRRSRSRNENVVDRLIKYGENRKSRIMEEGKKRREELEKSEVRELSCKPKLSQKTLEISKKNNKNYNYKSIHEKLFYKGLEEMRIHQEKLEIEFSKIHPFHPNLEKKEEILKKNSGIMKIETVTSKSAKETYNRLMTHQQLKEEKLNLIRKLEGNYDKETGQKLFKPKISKKNISSFLNKPVKNCDEFIRKCRQIFEFLDIDNEELIFANKTNLGNFHPKTIRLLTPLILEIFLDDDLVSMDFPLFYKMIREGRLEKEVEKIFDVLNSQNWNNKKNEKIMPPFKN